LADCIVLLNSGDELLLNDGTSNLLLNECEAVDTSTGGLLQKQRHRKPDILKGEAEIICIAQISSTVTLGVVGQIMAKLVMPLVSKISGLSECFTRGKICDNIDLVTEARIASNQKLKTMGDVVYSQYGIPVYKTNIIEKHDKKVKLLYSLRDKLNDL